MIRSASCLRRNHYSYHGPGRYEVYPDRWEEREFDHRGFTVGIGGPVGSGKTALVEQLCNLLPIALGESIAVVTNDIFTQEDKDYLLRNEALPKTHLRAVETGGCPHAAIREDVTANLRALEDLTQSTKAPVLLCESGGDNLAANFSSELADMTLYVIDVAGGDKVPRKGGPGITQSDVLCINKIDLAEAVGADLDVMERDALKMRGDIAPTVFMSVKQRKGLDQIVARIIENYQQAMDTWRKDDVAATDK